MGMYQERREAEARVLKLEAERKLLVDQASRSYQLREWVKAGATAVAFLGVLFTAGTALVQLSESRKARSDERFEQAVKNLAEDKPAQRLSGVSALNGFLTAKVRQEDAMSALINALAIENEPVVRDAITDVFAHLDGSVTESALNSALRATAARSRTVGRTVLRARGGHPLQVSLDDLEPQDGKLVSLGRVITSLMRSGATYNDLARIYCIGCDFGGIKVKGISFDGATLVHSTFERSEFINSSFRFAQLGGVDFRGTVLRGSKFSTSTPGDGESDREGSAWRYAAPDFQCADLSDADFTEFDFEGFKNKSVKLSLNIAVPMFWDATLTNTDFRSATFLTLGPFPGTPPLPAKLLSATAVEIDGKGLGDKGGISLTRWKMGSGNSRRVDLQAYQEPQLKFQFDLNWRQGKFDPAFQQLLERARLRRSTMRCR